MTYRIAERDALTEIEERARQVDWHKVLDKRKVENYQGRRTGCVCRVRSGTGASRLT